MLVRLRVVIQRRSGDDVDWKLINPIEPIPIIISPIKILVQGLDADALPV